MTKQTDHHPLPEADYFPEGDKHMLSFIKRVGDRHPGNLRTLGRYPLAEGKEAAEVHAGHPLEWQMYERLDGLYHLGSFAPEGFYSLAEAEDQS